MAIRIDTIETTSLGDRSYLVSDGDVAVVVDPQRDIDRVLAAADEHGVRISHVVETHVHNDYVSGGLQLARDTGATYVLPASSGAEFEHTAIEDSDVISSGQLRLSALHTPGHTHHHVSYVLGDDQEQVHAVFTGGSMLYGATGRTDLVGPDSTVELTHAQYHSVRRLAATLPPGAVVMPTHGFGSFCSATPATGDASTVGEQRAVNPALTLAEQEYVDTLLAGLDAYPAYYARMGPMNRRGPAPIDLSTPEPVKPITLRTRIETGQWVVDLRDRTAFAAGHLTGSLGFELSTPFVTYLGWLYRYGEPVTLIGESPEQITRARRELARIGIDQLAGAATDHIDELADGYDLRSYPVNDFAGLAGVRDRPEVRILDTRRNDERARGYVTASQHIPLPELADRLDEIAEGQIWVYCGSGYRASIAASILDRAGRDVVLINDAYDAAVTIGLQQPTH
ncbi:MAG TPA: MBL fold metallo-hydrolase [Pseudonocardia sp.]|jgi:glyoxylase-like metal-dependent hydrolase (beta-lactamase superfamily II)/rhodanese-related sulfurtransferase|nr:MBL fold metallo-hydrolase [Pseudonocardia sp.]